MCLSFEVSETERQHLTELADRLNVPAEALPAAALRVLLTRREAAFGAAGPHLAEKNAELYRRLA
ncbi:MAG: DNA-binding protein [Gemmatimonas sp.]